jgi:hypothetical protein
MKAKVQSKNPVVMAKCKIHGRHSHVQRPKGLKCIRCMRLLNLRLRTKRREGRFDLL